MLNLYIGGMIVNITMFLISFILILFSYKLLSGSELTYILILFLMGFLLHPIFYICVIIVVISKNNGYIDQMNDMLQKVANESSKEK